ncbi:MAG: ACP S-malonyltransferase [Treponema sp.]|jgi:[acyl-carrier-protein] S-malonyltransferase|nr:ACP S-malonyltransferase [Treponema sp.]
MVKKTVLLFPGQGAGKRGMAFDFLAVSAGAKRLFETASETMGRDMEELLRTADEESLKRSDIAQPAITLANLAAAAFLREKGVEACASAGHSLGEYAALVVSGSITAEDVFRLVKARGEAMQKTAERIKTEAGDPPGMAAVLGLPPEEVESLIAAWSAAGLEGLYAANINSPRQLVVSGTSKALSEAEKRFREAGARRVVRLAVAGPFHSPLMKEAAEEFRPVLEQVTFKDPVIPFYSNVTGTKIKSGEEIKRLALLQITSPVRWVDEEKAINAAGGFAQVLEAGPGTVLQGLWKEISGIPCLGAGTVEEIELL